MKYNHLVANCLIFYNVSVTTRVLHTLLREGYDLDEEAMAGLSPYVTEHINRFGRYQLDLTRTPPAVDYTVPILRAR